MTATGPVQTMTLLADATTATLRFSRQLDPGNQMSTPPFKFAEDQCDVHDREKLSRYRENAARWFDWLDGDPEHAISRQLSDLMWHDAAFRTLNEARRLDGAENSASRAPLLAQFIDQGYVSGQVLGISKLAEFSDPKRPKQGVISLKRIVDELSANRDLFTREVFVSHDALPYEYEAVEQAYIRDYVARNGTKSEAEWIDVEGPASWSSAQRQHELFDRLTGVAPDRRQREDRLPDRLFDQLVAALEDPVFQQIRDLRHKRLAHAADAVSRLQRPERKGLKLDEAATAHRILLGVLQTISAGVLYGSWRGAAIPIPQHNILEHFPDPLVRADQVEVLRAHWDQLAAERDGWLREGYAAFIPLES